MKSTIKLVTLKNVDSLSSKVKNGKALKTLESFFAQKLQKK
jgi:hypothetical protein